MMISESEVTKYLIDDGIGPHLRGFELLRSAIMLALEDESSSYLPIKEVYKILEQKTGIERENILKSIRYVLSKKKIKPKTYIALSAEKLKIVSLQQSI